MIIFIVPSAMLWTRISLASTHRFTSSDDLNRCIQSGEYRSSNQRPARGQQAAVAQHALAIGWIRNWQGTKLGFQQDALQRTLSFWRQRHRHLFGFGEGLKTRIVEEDSLSLAALDDKESRPLLVESAPETIDKPAHQLQFRARFRRASG